MPALIASSSPVKPSSDARTCPFGATWRFIVRFTLREPKPASAMNVTLSTFGMMPAKRPKYVVWLDTSVRR
jgi:hypothetical protein